MAQAVSQDLRLLKSVVVVLGVLLIAGTGALVASIMLRTSSHAGRAGAGPGAGPGAPMTLSLPREARIGHVALDGNRLALHIEQAGQEEILVVDLDSGEVTRRVAVARE